MSGIRADWLVHGCMNLGEVPEETRVSLNIRDSISDAYGGTRFAVRMWPRTGFKNTIWWSEKDVAPYNAAYFLKVDPWRGPALYAGITVEKGVEDPQEAMRRAQEKGIAAKELLLGKGWDWDRAVSSLGVISSPLGRLVRAVGTEIYYWLEFGESQRDSRYFVVKKDGLYQRGGFRPVPWDDLREFASRSRPQDWGNMFVAKAFSLDECTPELDVSRVLEVFAALKQIRDSWRGLAKLVPAATPQME
jgi:hypothetical protein